ncbi:hypothetical protein BHYA_0175g00150 [Botrytis hyacinthi]|uniref:Zn(2)-C6 fungal-type domain-containing protein n=1 Tax=Botrytis hyacinthi TaxID=278943 RepID=A0A4Z1GHP4_9HELO|nr:hypothetical protein BHYA_0175g00150 [Botrytis hyacinthi]
MSIGPQHDLYTKGALVILISPTRAQSARREGASLQPQFRRREEIITYVFIHLKESFLADDEGQESKYPPLRLFPPDQEIICQYREKILLDGADKIIKRIIVCVPEPSYIIPFTFPRPAGPSSSINTFTDDLQMRGLLKDEFSSDPCENFYDGVLEACQPDLDRLLRICIPNVFQKGSHSEAGSELDQLASNTTSKRFYVFANILIFEPDLNLPASISLSKRLSFAAQDFLDSDEPDEPRLASSSNPIEFPSLTACIPCHKRRRKCDRYSPCSRCSNSNFWGNIAQKDVPDVTSKEADVTNADRAVASKAPIIEIIFKLRGTSEGSKEKRLEK